MKSEVYQLLADVSSLPTAGRFVMQAAVIAVM
jgi:hypothetical protein